jgi:recombination protein RecA
MRFSDLVQSAVKKFGEGRVSTRGLTEIHYFIYPRCFALMEIIGRDGWPSGRLSVIQGLESSGKTTVALQALAECQSRGGVPIYLECESAFEEARANSLGLYTERYILEKGLDLVPLLILRPTHIPEAFQMIEQLVTKIREQDEEVPICVVWDSVAATPPSVEVQTEKDAYQVQRPGSAAREVSLGFRRLNSVLSDTQTVLICTNFIKQAIQTFPGARPQGEDATIAQRALGQHASVRIKLERVSNLKSKDGKTVGIRVRAKATKNKLAPPFRTTEFDLFYTTGMDDEGSKLEAAKRHGLVVAKGSWLVYGDQTFRAADWPSVPFYDQLMEELWQKVRSENRLFVEGEPLDEDDEDEEDF